ncbi:hypothetical protein [Roseixanthobacter glucoisosaccharinicivorans]|uniref:hypothetical protein n=1 Tax=Roseixanthobacter glucoisosaccharinicivorans TaxID=3119923 RepID=UPI0037291CC2
MMSRVLPYVLTLIAAVCAALVVMTTLRAMYDAYIPLPFMDQWAVLSIQDCMDQLFAQHNEHRIVVFRLLSILDYLLARGTYLVNFYASILLQLIHAFTLAALVYWAGVRGRVNAVLAGAIALGYMFWGGQWENFLYSFQTQFFAVFLAGTLAFAALAAVRGWAGVGAASLCAALAVGSLSNGVLVCLLLPPLAVWLGRPWRETAVGAGVAVGLIALYLVGYQSPDPDLTPFAALLKPLTSLRYTLAYLGQPLEELLRVQIAAVEGHRHLIAIAMGAIGVGLGVFAGVVLVARPSHATPARLVLLHVIVFIAASAALTSLGRLTFGVGQALASRYLTPSLVFWLALTFLWWSLLPGRIRILAPASAVCALVLMAGYGHHVDAVVQALRLSRDGAATALLSNVRDDEEFAKIFLDPEVVAERAELLRRRQLALFAEPWASWRGTPLSAHATLRPASACLGAFAGAQPVPGTAPGTAFRVTGWAWDPARAGAPDKILLVDAGGIIVGYGLTEGPRPVIAATLPPGTPQEVSWRGHVKLTGSTQVAAFILLDDGRSACPLGGPRLLDGPL